MTTARLPAKCSALAHEFANAHGEDRGDEVGSGPAGVGELGDLVEVSLGLFPYPMPSPLPARSRRCAQVPARAAQPPLVVTVTPTDAVIVAGADTDATVTVQNDGSARAEFDTGGLQGVVVRRGARDVVGVSTLGVAL